MDNLQWYPGHMAKTRRLIEENLKYIDAVVEITDARVPLSGRNPCFDDIITSKPRVIIMNKTDLADPDISKEWSEYFKHIGLNVIPVSCESGLGIKELTSQIRNSLSERLQKDALRGVNRPIRIMMIGIPNVGKSTLINRISKKAAAKTGDRPGVTKSKQWVRLQNGLEMLDTPGILPPKFDNQEIAEKLAYTGAIRDEIIDCELLCCELLEFLRDNYPQKLIERYKIDSNISDKQGYDLLLLIGKRRGCVISGGEIDTQRASAIILDEFRSSKIGRITLERPEK